MASLTWWGATGEADPVEPMDLIELERNMLMTMPGGWKMSQIEPAQPATTYAEFKKEILNEIARCGAPTGGGSVPVGRAVSLRAAGSSRGRRTSRRQGP
jgi:hypothetical protein